jgi:hypothetical protein
VRPLQRLDRLVASVQGGESTAALVQGVGRGGIDRQGETGRLEGALRVVAVEANAG